MKSLVRSMTMHKNKLIMKALVFMSKVGAFLHRVSKKKHFGTVLKVSQVLSFILILSSRVVFAEPSVDNLASFIAGWGSKAGSLVALIGAFMFGFGFKDDDPGLKSKGTNTFVAGAIVFAVGKSYTTFM